MPYYSSRPVMKDVKYTKENKDFVKKLLAHDPDMLGYVSNFDLELLIPVIDKSITYLHRVNIFDSSSLEEAVKIAKYAYSKNRSARKILYDLFRRGLMDLENLDTIKDELSLLFLEIMKYNPTLLIFSNQDFKSFLESKLGIDLKKLASSINYNSFIKKIMALSEECITRKDDWRSRNNQEEMYFFDDKIFGYAIKETGVNWGHSKLLSEKEFKTVKDHADLIEEFSIEYGVEEKLSKLVLFLKLKA